MNNYHSKKLLYSGLAGLLLVTLALVMIPLRADPGSGKKGDVIRGAREWATNCVRCHEMRDPTEFSDNLWRPVIQHMRLEGGLTGQQTRDILAFIQSIDYHPLVPVAMPTSSIAKQGDGKAVFTQTCIACHGADGKGAVPGAPDFTSASGPLSKSDDVLLQHVINGFRSPGNALAMPPRGGNPGLSDSDLREALAYIRKQFGHGQ